MTPAELRHEAWLLPICIMPAEDFPGFDRAPYVEALARHPELPPEDPWPVDPKRGVLVNDAQSGRYSVISWEVVGFESAPDPPPGNFDWMRILLCDDEHPRVTPELCEPDACYFTSPLVLPTKGPRRFVRPGVWVALRQHEGRTVLAGVLIHKTAPKDPVHDPLFLKWRAELATRYPIAPVPAADLPASWAEAIIRGAVGALRTALRAP